VFVRNSAADTRDRILRTRDVVQCRIEVRHENEQMVVRLAGRLGQAQVAALLEACSGSKEPPLLELDDLVSADAMGVDALLRLKERGVRFVGLPEYLRLKLDDLLRRRRR
jgi:hypothetical protein